MGTNHIYLLQKTVLFQDMTDAEYEGLISCLSPHTKSFSKGEAIVLSGYPVKHIGIILYGNARAYSEDINGEQTIISTLSPMSMFGESLVSTRTHLSPVTVYAVTDVTVAFIEYQSVYSMCAAACAAHRIFLQNMLKIMGDKYFLLFDRINILRKKTLRQRIMAYLYTLSNNGSLTVVSLPFTKTMLAEYLLANRSALSKELGKMEKEGIICVNKRKITLKFLEQF